MSMKIYRFGKDDLSSVFGRSQMADIKMTDVIPSSNDKRTVKEAVREILADIKNRGDEALFKYVKELDGLNADEKNGLLVSEEEIENAYKAVPESLLGAMRRSKDNVLEYHKRQVAELKDKAFCDSCGTTGWVYRAVESAGIYVPGGTAPYPSSVLMCVLPAVAAGVREVVMTSPNPKNPLTLVAARECGVEKIYKAGGAQAIGALAYGTETVKKVDVIAGPGNIFVLTAKKEVYGEVAIDMLAGPSELLVIADKSADPVWAAADLLSQAEHDRLAACILVTDSEELAHKVLREVDVQLAALRRKEIASASIESNGAIIVVKDLFEAVEISNRIAPEHLELFVADPDALLKEVKNAGAVFMGRYSPEPLGDYFAGPSHCLPTSGTAKYFEVLSSDTFMKRMSVINYTKEGLNKASQDIIAFAECEGFGAHANSVRVRSEK